MRICIAATEYAGVTSYSGGIGSQYAALAPALAADGHDVVAIAAQPGASAELERDGVRIHVLGLPRRLTVRVAALPLAVNRALGRMAPFDAVVAAEYGAPAWRYVRTERSAGPLVTHLHTSLDQVIAISGWSRARRAIPGVALQRRLERSQATRSQGLIAPTRSLLSSARELWPLEGIPHAVIPNTADIGTARRLAGGAPPPGYPDAGPVVAFSGRLEARKGVHLLVQAMRRVWREHPEASLVLMGGDDSWQGMPMSEHLRRLAGDDAGRLRILGAQPPERLFPALAGADVVALPSLWEAFGIAALEAMALERALVVTSGHGFDEFIRPGVDALAVPPGDADALAGAIGRLLSDPQLREGIGRSARRRADDYDVPLAAAAFAEGLAALLRGERAPATA